MWVAARGPHWVHVVAGIPKKNNGKQAKKKVGYVGLAFPVQQES